MAGGLDLGRGRILFCTPKKLPEAKQDQGRGCSTDSNCAFCTNPALLYRQNGKTNEEVVEKIAATRRTTAVGWTLSEPPWRWPLFRTVSCKALMVPVVRWPSDRRPTGSCGCGSKNRYQNGTLVSGNMDQPLRNPSV